MTGTGLRDVARMVREAKHVVVFTGAGISVESGIPPFRGPEGLWSRYDPSCLDLTRFYADPAAAWVIIREIFYDFFGQARPNAAHEVVAALEDRGIVKAVITQNIDNLHQDAGSREVIEFHGTASTLLCVDCGHRVPAAAVDLAKLPPQCMHCGGVCKPDFIFFGEPIPEEAHRRALHHTEAADLFLVIGTTGEIMPASMLPVAAFQNGARIIEVNVRPSRYTDDITQVFLQGPATVVMEALLSEI